MGDESFLCYCSRVCERMLFHLDPFSFVDAYQVTALTFHFISFSDAIIFYYSVFPTVP